MDEYSNSDSTTSTENICDQPIIVTENALDRLFSSSVNDLSKFRTYKRRWYLLGVIGIINFANALIWIVFSPITDKTAGYNGMKATFMEVNWFSLVYLVVSIPSGLVASWILDTFGLRASIISAAWLNFIGSSIRNLTVFSFIPHDKTYAVLLVGQVVAAFGQTFVMFTPAKVAALWFPDNQRAIANTVAAMSNPLGILAANLLSPAIVKESADIKILLWICTGVSVIGVLMSTLGVCSSLPPTPPSASAAAQSEPFFLGIKKLKGNSNFWALSFAMGGGLATFTASTTFMEQILCPRNYTNTFAGLCGALLIGVGVIGAFIAGLIVDRTKKFSEVAKIGFCFSTLFSIAFVQLSRYREMEIPIAVCIALYGGFGFAIYPTCLELAVEVTYPVAEATSTGITFLSGQIQGIIVMLVAQFTAQPLSNYDIRKSHTCPSDGEFEPQDWTVPNLICNSLNVLYTVVIVLFFHANYKRLKADVQIQEKTS